MAKVPVSRSGAGGRALLLLVPLLLAGLPLAVWLDLTRLSEAMLLRQAGDLNSIISSVRAYYATNVVGRVLAGPGQTRVAHNYEAVPGAIPIPATLSLELGGIISGQEQNIVYRFVSDFPFQNRKPHVLDDFEKRALSQFRSGDTHPVTDASASFLTDRVRFISPVIMTPACVACHNSHPESPKRDWKVGDVRGIQEVTISNRIAANIFSFKYLLAYFALVATTGFTFIALQLRQAASIQGLNRELETTNEFLASLSMKISHYLSPQIYRSIFSGEKDATIHTERKKLTIFFSDIKDFTSITERLQPEQITRLLNDYFTEMSAIALKYSGTIDKFIGDAMLIFFGDPESKGEAEDARACLRMAVEMQHRLAQLNTKWRNEGVEQPFRVRMGINTGFCNVGNFGSTDRMDYTVIGAEANLAARLQSVAEPGHIVISYETFALVRAIVVARPLPAITMKGISRAVIPYSVEGMLNAEGEKTEIFSENMTGLDLYLDPTMLDTRAAEHVRSVLKSALAALEKSAPNGSAARATPEV